MGGGCGRWLWVVYVGGVLGGASCMDMDNTHVRVNCSTPSHIFSHYTYSFITPILTITPVVYCTFAVQTTMTSLLLVCCSCDRLPHPPTPQDVQTWVGV